MTRAPGTAAAPHVVVDVRLARAAGHRTYIRNLVPRLAALTPAWRWSLVGDAELLRREEWAQGDNIAIVHCGAPVYGLREQIELPLRVPRDADLYWATHYNVPLALRKPLVVTMHDAAHLRLPEYTTKSLRHAYARFMFKAALARASAIVCNSEFTRRELLELVGSPAAPITVVHMGIDESWFQRDESLAPVEPPYFVFVGNLKPHKNVRTLLAAFRNLEGQVAERLVIVGKADRLMTPDTSVLDEITSLGERVVMAGELADDQLRALVRSATALIMPSLYEGFGFPPLEAMAAGCPAIVARSASLPEVCGDAAVYFDARDAGQLSQAMLKLAKDAQLRCKLVERGRAHARAFNWDVSAGKTLEVLQGVLAAGS